MKKYLGKTSDNRPQDLWQCKCECGRSGRIPKGNLVNGVSKQCVECRGKFRKRVSVKKKGKYDRLWKIAKQNCCDEWMNYDAFHKWVESTKNQRVFRRRDESLPYSPENCFWSQSLPNGDRFRGSVAELRQKILGESHEASMQWVTSVTRQRAHQWYRRHSAGLGNSAS